MRQRGVEGGIQNPLPVWFLMPDPQPRRVRVAKQLTSPRRVTPPLDEEALRNRLRDIRDDTVEHLDDLLGQLTSTLREQYGITPLEATTAQEAADEIARLAGPSLRPALRLGSGQGSGQARRVLVNRSATVAELLPYLKAHGLEVVETYDGQFSHPDQGVERYWQLELPSAEAAWEAFRPFVVNWETGKASPIYQSTNLPVYQLTSVSWASTSGPCSPGAAQWQGMGDPRPA